MARRSTFALAMLLTSSFMITACQRGDTEPDISVVDDAADRFPSIVSATAAFDATTQLWSIDVTMSSPYDTPERYADGWRVIGPDGAVYGVHTLTHDHAGEQPFTRRQSGVSIPEDVASVTIEGRDRSNGFGGSTVTIDLQTG